jgi:hypothetical protein
MFDIDGDDRFDTAFGWDEEENEKFSWYLQSGYARLTLTFVFQFIY